MPWTRDLNNGTWLASEYNDLNMTTANNLIVYGQPYQPSDTSYDAVVALNHRNNPVVTVQMPQQQIMEFGYGSGVQLDDFGAGSLLGQSTTLANGYYTKQDMIDAGLATSSDFSVGSNLYTPGLNIADGGPTAAYVHGGLLR